MITITKIKECGWRRKSSLWIWIVVLIMILLQDGCSRNLQISKLQAAQRAANNINEITNTLLQIQNTLSHSQKITEQTPTSTTTTTTTSTTTSIRLAAATAIANLPPSRNGGSPDVNSYRTLVLSQNIDTILKNNADPARKYDMGVNEFSDLELTEINKKFACLIIPDQILKSVQLEKSLLPKDPSGLPLFPKPQPLSLNWTCYDQKLFTSHGICKSAYIFAPLTTVYILRKMNGKVVMPLSAQEVMSCGWNNGTILGCQGGYYGGVYQYVKGNGVGPSMRYAYNNKSMLQGANTECDKKTLVQKVYNNAKARIKDYKRIPYGNCKQLVTVLKRRPVTVGVAGYGFQFYRNGTYHTKNRVIDYAVALVGYDKERGYLVKNSMGMSWGQLGYGWVDESSGVCEFAMYPVLEDQVEVVKPCA